MQFVEIVCKKIVLLSWNFQVWGMHYIFGWRINFGNTR